jgi:hypothetical protein
VRYAWLAFCKALESFYKLFPVFYGVFHFDFSLRLFQSRLASDGKSIVAIANKVNRGLVVSEKIVENKQKPRKTQGFLLGKDFLVGCGQDCQSHRRVDFRADFPCQIEQTSKARVDSCCLGFDRIEFGQQLSPLSAGSLPDVLA